MISQSRVATSGLVSPFFSRSSFSFLPSLYPPFLLLPLLFLYLFTPVLFLFAVSVSPSCRPLRQDIPWSYPQLSYPSCSSGSQNHKFIQHLHSTGNAEANTSEVVFIHKLMWTDLVFYLLSFLPPAVSTRFQSRESTHSLKFGLLAPIPLFYFSGLLRVLIRSFF